jgi:PadR family transcriptional regulator PadR
MLKKAYGSSVHHALVGIHPSSDTIVGPTCSGRGANPRDYPRNIIGWADGAVGEPPLDNKWKSATLRPKFVAMSSKSPKQVELLQGTLDLIVLRSLFTMGPQHAYGLASRLEQIGDHPLLLNQGTLYPALVRLEQKGWIKGPWQQTESNRQAKYYSITKSGTRALGQQEERWRRLSSLVNRLLLDHS